MRILVDDRERKPWSFSSIPEDQRYGGGFMEVEIVPARLETGDYTTERLRDIVTIERKSLPDLYQTLAKGRSRFESEFERMMSFAISLIVVEASYHELLTNPPSHTRMPAKAVSRTIMRLIIEYPKVQWLFLDSRRVAEVWTAKFLSKCEREIK